MFQLSAAEHNSLMLQIATSKPGRGGRRKPPLVFTEHGAIMAATLLNSSRAVEMSIFIVRAFVQLRYLVAANTELAQRVTKLERGHEAHDGVLVGMLKAIGKLQNVPETRAIGFFELKEEKK